MQADTIGLDPIPERSRGWVVTIDGPEISRLSARYRAEGVIGEDEWENVVATAARVLGQCPDPRGPPGSKTGLAIGKVQSGKTTSYTALIALAADNGYRITVVLAGTKNPLLEQTDVRLRHYLDTTRRAIVGFKNPDPVDVVTIVGVLQGGGHALLTALKHHARIDNLAAVISSADLRHYPVLLIDDEGDEASLNTRFRSDEQSSTYRSIIRMRATIPLHGYLAYTATPQANLLIPAIDDLSPDFCTLVQPGHGYCGGSIFFGEDRDRYLREIPDADVPEEEEEPGVPRSLQQALAVFFVGSAVRRLRGETQDLHSMLVHTSHRRVGHDATQAALRTLIDLWKERLLLPDGDPAREGLIQLFKEAHEDLSRSVRGIVPWVEVLSQVRQEVRLVEIWMVNSLPLGRDPVTTPFHLRNNVFVGGNMLGRGVTIDGLAVTYITRRAKRETNADTMEQRARWFGYKTAYLDLCRIFVTHQLKEEYSGLLEHEDDFWDALSRNESQGVPLRDWRRIFFLASGTELNPTRSNVARYRRFRPRGWDSQTRAILDPDASAANVHVAHQFFTTHPGELRQFGHLVHRVAPRVPIREVIDDLLGQMDFGSTWDGAYYCEYLTRLSIAGTLPEIDVLLMEDGHVRTRSPDDQGRYNPFQGRNREPGDPLFYPGDQHLNDERPQVQVHIVHPIVTGIPDDFSTTFVGINIPSGDPRFDLRYVVRVDVE